MKTIRIVRDLATPQGVTSRNVVSTDVMNAVNRWRSLDSSREVGAVREEECVFIEINWRPNDILARDLLNSFFLENGLKVIDSLKENLNDKRRT